MATLFFLLTLVLIIAVIFFLVKRNWKNSFLSLVGVIVSFVIFFIAIPVEDTESNTLSETQTTSSISEEESTVEAEDTEPVFSESVEDSESESFESSEETESESFDSSEDFESGTNESSKESESESSESIDKTELESSSEIESSDEEFNPENYNEAITYEDIARNPNDYLYEPITFEGTIVQVMQGDAESQYRIAINDNYDTIMLLAIPNELLESRILEDDYIRFWGTHMGEITYESTLSGNITIPGSTVDHFELIQ